MRPHFALFAATVSLLVSACAGPAANGAGLADSRWRIVRLDGGAPASGEASVAFERERLTASVGCNRMNGPWRIEGGRLIAGPLMQTKMGCPGRIGEQESALGTLLAAAPKLTLSGERMTLASSGHSAELVRGEP